MNPNVVTIDGRAVPFNGERNLLELVRKAGIDLPTFCYHSDLSIYGACRLCLVEVAGRGIQGACSTPLEPGLVVRTSTEEIREIRRITVELLLANHDQSCPTCPKSASCQLQSLARKLGVQKVRFKPVQKPAPVDTSSVSLVRDPNKCVLCGDCTRMCSEVQGIGAIDFAFRGHDAAVVPSFGKDLAAVECVNCGQCAAVCPTGALAPRSEVAQVWKALSDPSKTVVAQIAPAVRVALGESFGLAPGESTTGQAVAALRALGFEKVYDTAWAADLTVLEEATEFLERQGRGERLPQFTSCCPAWVKFAEQYFPELLPKLSSCRSPQQMLGSLAKKLLPDALGVDRKDLVVVAVMPCTAKKFEARRPELATDGVADVDHVLTTVELAQMIEEAGLRFRDLAPESFDLPMGFKTGAGVIFGASGGVTEAVLRFAGERLAGRPLDKFDFHEVRGERGLREAQVQVGAATLKLAVVHGLANARALAERVRAGACDYDLVEVMACPGGCIGGAGQPVVREGLDARRRRAGGLFAADQALELHASQQNPFLRDLYGSTLGAPGSEQSHALLHTHYQSRRRLADEEIALGAPPAPGAGEKIRVDVCVGTSCFLHGSQGLLQGLLKQAAERDLEGALDIRASFCFERCGSGPSAQVDGLALQGATEAKLRQRVDEALCARGARAAEA